MANNPDTRRYDWTGYSHTAEWASSLPKTFSLFAKRAGAIKNLDQQNAIAGENALPRVLNWFHVAMLGTGMIVGAGIFVSTGVAANEYAGPAVVISFLLAGLSSLLSALCYSEFAAEFPVAGGAFNYILVSMGEYTAWLVVTTLVMEYILANAAIARSFTAYFATLIGKPTDFFIIPYQDYSVDFMAAGLVCVLCVLLMFTTGGGSWFNLVVTLSQLVVIAIILIAGFTKANPANMTPFAPNGFGGIFNGASFVFFSFIGFDCVSTLAEEVKNPGVDMPIGIVGCISFVTIIYTVMALCLVMMVPYDQIDTAASFATAFTQVGYPWGQYLVALGAVLGIVTGVLVGMMGVSRIVCGVSRSHLFLPLFGKVSPKFGTPMWATLFTSVATLPLAILTDLPALIDMVSAGTLMVFAVVAVALIWKRYTARDAPRRNSMKSLLMLGLVVSMAIGVGVVYGVCEHGSKTFFIAGGVLLGGTILMTVVMHLTCPQFHLPKYKIPLFPYLPVASILLNSLLMGSIGAQAYIQLAVYFAVMTFLYLVYSIHAASHFEKVSGLVTPDLEGQKATDLPHLYRTSDVPVSFTERPASGRWSGGVHRLPPATLG